ncbi:MAG: hypothetical protein ACNA8W_24385 [Bradymonadaceae bacterium]
MSTKSHRFIPSGILIALFITALAGGCRNDESLGEISATNLRIDPPSIHFPATHLGAESEESTILHNSGEATLRLRGFDIVPAQGKSAEAFALIHPSTLDDISLEPGESFEVIVRYQPIMIADYQAELRLATNLPNRSTVAIDLHTQRLAPEIYSPQGVDFRDVSAGEARWTMSYIQNIGSVPLHISDIVIQDPAFAATFPGGTDSNAPPSSDTDNLPTLLEPGEMAWMRLWYEPSHELITVSTLEILSDDPRTPSYEVFLYGNASGGVCTVAGHEPDESFSEQCNEPPPRSAAPHRGSFGPPGADASRATVVTRQRSPPARAPRRAA